MNNITDIINNIVEGINYITKKTNKLNSNQVMKLELNFKFESFYWIFLCGHTLIIFLFN